MFDDSIYEIKGGMVYLPGGTFVMGAREEETAEIVRNLKANGDIWADVILSEQPRHDVFLSPFYIDMYEVTQGEFLRVMGYNPSRHKGGPCLPVDSATKPEAMEYCRRVGKRLPTEAEYEYAARGGANTTFFWGEDEESADEYAWYAKNSGLAPHPVGTKKPNAFGLYDMIGNMWEWCSDNFSLDYYKPDYYTKHHHINPHGPSFNGGEFAERSAIRGGSYMSFCDGLRCANRGRHMPDNPWELHNATFRCVYSVAFK